jgi:hypothetical protein
MKIFLTCIAFIMSWALSAQNNDFKVIKASKQMQYGGVMGSPIISYYEVRVKAKRKLSISVDSAWAEGKKDQAYILLDSSQIGVKKTVKKGQILTIAVAIKSESSSLGGLDQTATQPGSPSSSSPCNTPSKICIPYTGGKSKMLSFNNLTVLQAQFGQ